MSKADELKAIIDELSDEDLAEALAYARWLIEERRTPRKQVVHTRDGMSLPGVLPI